MIPPRPMGYDRHRELIDSRNDLAFDALSAAESAAAMTINMILHPSRAGRLIEYHARDPKQPGLEAVIDKLTNSTIKSAPKSGYEGAVQIVVNDVLINALIRLAATKDASTQVRAVAFLKLKQLDSWIKERSKTLTNENWRAHFMYAQERIRRFTDDPQDFKIEISPNLPPGAPIGAGSSEFCDGF